MFFGLIEYDVLFSIFALEKPTTKPWNLVWFIPPTLNEAPPWNKHRTNSSFETEKVRVAHVRGNTVLRLASKKRDYLIIIRGRPLLELFPKNVPSIWRRKTVKLYNLVFWFCVSDWKSCIDAWFFFHIFSFA